MIRVNDSIDWKTEILVKYYILCLNLTQNLHKPDIDHALKVLLLTVIISFIFSDFAGFQSKSKQYIFNTQKNGIPQYNHNLSTVVLSTCEQMF